MKKKMELKNWNVCDTVGVIMWSLIATLAMVIIYSMVFFFENASVFYLMLIALTSWGVIAGLSYGESSRFCIVKKSLLIVCISMVLLIVMLSTFMDIADPVRVGDFSEKIYRTISSATTFVFPLMGTFFFFGYAVAFVVKFSRRLYKKTL